ncbi:MAG: beta-N-acetylhexosaminidase [Bacteroidota bacterium]
MKRLFHLTILVFLATTVMAQEISIIPRPAELSVKQGIFLLGEDCSLQFDAANKDVVRIAGFFNETLQNLYGFRVEEHSKGNPVRFIIADRLSLGREGYLLKVKKRSIVITASEPAGLFYGMQSLKQLLPINMTDDALEIQCLDIQDQPRFPWRGNMLDVSRHFFPVSFIKKYIDILAMYKINTFQMHLTDNQGWRIEIKQYPLLTEKGAWREGTADEAWNQFAGPAVEGKPKYGGFYSQEEIREIVQYANKRYITVVPEIEMPAHSRSAHDAYPAELSCTGKPCLITSRPDSHPSQWDIPLFCAGKEETFRFLENVLDEVMALFPSQYIHIGGDEAIKNKWDKCPDCNRRMQDEGLEDLDELQSYFIKRIEKFVNSRGRKIIGWDEILEGGLAPEATVMSWRGVEGGVEAARQHHHVIMSPTTHMYLDYYQSKDKESEPFAAGNFLPVEKVYSYEPVPKELTEEEAVYILGVQTNLWTEFVPTTKHAEYMLLPRLQAQAEVAWTKKELKDYTNFEKRLENDYQRLEKLGINFRDHKKL